MALGKRAAARRARLLELGPKLFGANSYDRVSIENIADAAGASPGLLYHYFGGKRAYYVASIEYATERLVAHTVEGIMTSPKPRALGGLRAYFNFVESEPETYLVILQAGIGADREVARILDQTRSRFVELILKTAKMDTEGPLARVAIRGWVGMVEAMSLDWLERGEEERVDREAMLDLLLKAGIVVVQTAMGGSLPGEP